MDFLLVLTEVCSLAVTAEALRAKFGWKSAISHQRGPDDPKFQVEGVALTNHSSSQKTRLNYLWCGIKIWTDLPSILSQFTRLTDGQMQTDSFLIAGPRLHSMHRGENLYFNISITSRKLRTSRLGLVSAGEANITVLSREVSVSVSVSSFYVSCPSLVHQHRSTELAAIL